MGDEERGKREKDITLSHFPPSPSLPVSPSFFVIAYLANMVQAVRGPRRMRPSTTMALAPGDSTFTGFRSRSRSSGILSTSAETRNNTAIRA
jgi:hypothetical protein